MSDAPVVIQDVTIRIKGKTILQDITMSAKAGSITGITGTNGSGKSVLFKTICGFIPPVTGSIFINSQRYYENNRYHSNDVGFLIEAPGLLPHETATKNLYFYGNLNGKTTEQECKNLLTMVGLDPNNNAIVKKYSFGMKQRLGIAVALTNRRNIIILDEPMNGLDLEGVNTIRELLISLKKEGKTILIASHGKNDIEILCDKVYQIENQFMVEKQTI